MLWRSLFSKWTWAYRNSDLVELVIRCMQTLSSASRELKEWLYEEKTFFTRWLAFCLGYHYSAEHLYFYSATCSGCCSGSLLSLARRQIQRRKGKKYLSVRGKTERLKSFLDKMTFQGLLTKQRQAYPGTEWIGKISLSKFGLFC